MTNNKIFGLFFLLTPIFQILTMEQDKNSVKNIIRVENYNLIAKRAIQIYDSSGYDKMRKFIVSKGDVSDFKFFNKICKIIAYNEGKIHIFADELFRIYSSSNLTLWSHRTCTFFSQFCTKLQIGIVKKLVNNLANNCTSSELNRTKEIIIYLVLHSRNVVFICHLATWLKGAKDQLLRDYCRTKTFSELLDSKVLKFIQYLNTEISALASAYTNKMVGQNIKYNKNFVVIMQAACDTLWREQNTNQVLDFSDDLTQSQKKELGIYLFSHYFVVNSDYLAASENINRLLSIIYDNHYHGIVFLGYDGWTKRIDDMLGILSALKRVNPKAFELSLQIKDASLLCPIVKSFSYLNNHITQCITAKITKNMICGEKYLIKEDLKFLLKTFGPIYFKKCLILVMNGLIAQVEEYLDLNANGSNPSSIHKKMFKDLSQAFKWLTNEIEIQPFLARYATSLFADLKEVIKK